MATFDSILNPAKKEPAPVVTGLRASPVAAPEEPAIEAPMETPEAPPTGTFAQMLGAAAPASTAPPATGLRAQPAEGPGFLMGVAGDIAGGVVDYAALAARAGRGVPGGAEAGSVGREGITGTVISAAEKFKAEHPFVADVEREGFSRAVHQGIRSATTSIVAGLPGLAAGAAAGLAGGPLAEVTVPVGALIGFATSGAGTFGLAEYDSTLEEANRAGVDRSVSEPAAIMSGIAEAGFEFAGNILEGLTLGAAKIFTAPGKAALKQGVKGLIKQSAGQLIKRQLGVAAIETGSEVLTGGIQAEIKRGIGLTDQKFMDGAVEAFGPALVASAIFGGLGAGGLAVHKKARTAELSNPNTAPETRAAIAAEVGNAIREVDPDVANVWDTTSAAAIERGETIEVGDDLTTLRTQEHEDDLTAKTLQNSFPDHSVAAADGLVTITAPDGAITTMPTPEAAKAALAGVPVNELVAMGDTTAPPARTAGVEEPAVAAPEAEAGTLAPPEITSREERTAFPFGANVETPPATLDEALATTPVAEGATREVFTVDAPALQGNTFVEDTAPDGTKTLMAVRPTGEVRTPQAGEAKIIAEQARTPVEAQAPQTPVMEWAGTLTPEERTTLQPMLDVFGDSDNPAVVEVMKKELEMKRAQAAAPAVAPAAPLAVDPAAANPPLVEQQKVIPEIFTTPVVPRAQLETEWAAIQAEGADPTRVAKWVHDTTKNMLAKTAPALIASRREQGTILPVEDPVITPVVNEVNKNLPGLDVAYEGAATDPEGGFLSHQFTIKQGPLFGLTFNVRSEAIDAEGLTQEINSRFVKYAEDLQKSAARGEVASSLEAMLNPAAAQNIAEVQGGENEIARVYTAGGEGVRAATGGVPGVGVTDIEQEAPDRGDTGRIRPDIAAPAEGEGADVGAGAAPRPEDIRAPTEGATFTAEQIETEPAKTLKTMGAQTKKELQRIAARGKRALGGDTLAVQTAPTWLKVTPRSTLVELFKKRMPLITKYDKQFDTFVAARNAEVEDAGINYDTAIKAAKAGTGVDQLQTTAALGSFNQMTPWLPMEEQDWVPTGGSIAAAQKLWKAAGMQKATGKGFAEAYQETSAAYNKLSPATKEAYKVMVEDVAAVRKREKDAMQKIIEQSTEGDATARTEMLSRLEEAFAGLKGAYLPLYRYGDYSLTYTDPDTGNRAVEFFTTVAARDEQMDSLTAENPGTTAEEFGFQRTVREDLPKVTSSVPGSFMEQLTNTVREQYVEGVDPTDEVYDAKVAQADQVIKDMTQVWLRWQPETSALKNSLKRKNTGGFSKDMMRGYLRYMQTHGGNVAFLENGRPIEETLNDIADSIKEQKETGVDVTLDQSILTDLRARYAATRTVSVGGFASAVSRLGTFWYMTSPSIFLVQLSQIGVLTFPQLATKYSIGKASKALTKSMGQAFAPKFARKAMMDDVVVQTAYEDIMATVTPEDRADPRWADAELGSAKYSQGDLLSRVRTLDSYQKQLLALRVSMARNVLDISLTHEVNELVQGKDPNSSTAKVLKASMTFMRHGELASRKAAVLATFDLAQADGKNFFESMDEVVDVAKSTLYDYSREGKGVLLQGDISRVVMQFQHFRIMSMFKLGMLAKDTIKGDKTALKELTGIMGMSALLSGAMGVPLSGLTFQILSSIFGSDDEPYDAELDFTNWLRENFGETGARAVAHGAPSLLGVNLSRRIGLSDVTAVPGTDAPEYLHGDGLAAYYASQLLGPSYSVPSGWFKAYDDIVNRGDIERGLEAATPKPIRDVLKASRLAHEGLKTRAGKKLLKDEEISGADLFMMGLGFLPEEVSQAQEKSRKTAAIGGKISARRGRLIRDIVKKLESNDDLTDEVDAIREFNKKMPVYAVTSGEIRSGYKARARGEAGIPSRREALIKQDFGLE